MPLIIVQLKGTSLVHLFISSLPHWLKVVSGVLTPQQDILGWPSADACAKNASQGSAKQSEAQNMLDMDIQWIWVGGALELSSTSVAEIHCEPRKFAHFIQKIKYIDFDHDLEMSYWFHVMCIEKWERKCLRIT